MAKERLSKLQKQILLCLATYDNFDGQREYHERSQKMDCLSYEKLLKLTARKLLLKRNMSEEVWLFTAGFEPSFSRSLKNLEWKGLIERKLKRIMYGKRGTKSIWLTTFGRNEVKRLIRNYVHKNPAVNNKRLTG